VPGACRGEDEEEEEEDEEDDDEEDEEDGAASPRTEAAAAAAASSSRRRFRRGSALSPDGDDGGADASSMERDAPLRDPAPRGRDLFHEPENCSLFCPLSQRMRRGRAGNPTDHALA